MGILTLSGLLVGGRECRFVEVMLGGMISKLPMLLPVTSRTLGKAGVMLQTLPVCAQLPAVL